MLSTRDSCQSNLGSGARGYPKLRLAEMADSLYALNQSCRRIYEKLQQRNLSSQLMPLSAFPKGQINKQDPAASRASKAPKTGLKNPDGHVFDIMSAAAAVNGDIPCSYSASTSFISCNEPSLCRNGYQGKQLYKEPSSWWSRLFSTRRRSQDSNTSFVEEILKYSGQYNASLTKTEQSISESNSDFPYTCVVCGSSFKTHTQLDMHKERSSHFGCSICCEEFENLESLHDHCDMLSHWSESDDEADEDDYDTSSNDDDFLSDSSDISSEE